MTQPSSPPPFCPSPAQVTDAALRSVRTSDIEEQAAQLHGWQQHYSQLSAGAFKGEFRELRLPGLQLFFETTSSNLFQTGAIQADTVAIGLPLAYEGAGHFCGESMSGSALHFFAGKDGFEYLSPEGLVMSGIVIRTEDLMDQLTETEAARVSALLTKPQLVKVDEQSIASLRSFVASIAQMAEQAPLALENEQLRHALGQSVVSSFIDTMVTRIEADAPRLTSAQRLKLIKDVRDIVVSSPDAPPSIQDLCDALAVSRRTLQNCFQVSMNCTPLDFIKIVRLNGVRSMLRRCATVSEAAAHWGFWHFGNFARDYRSLFGALPSAEHAEWHHRG
jgi:AraC family ethanolamine operon transcriptional activator